MLRFMGELRFNEGITLISLHIAVNVAMIVLAGLYRVYDIQFAEGEVDLFGFLGGWGLGFEFLVSGLGAYFLY
jgi:hypothetical protein